MKNSKSLLNIGNAIADVTGLVQTVGAFKDGELKYRGCGIVIYRSNHINGNATIFLSYVGKEFVFGGWVETYSTDEKWKHWDYSEYEMKPLEHENSLITGHDRKLSKMMII